MYTQKSLQGKYIIASITPSSKLKVYGRVGEVDSLSSIEAQVNMRREFILIIPPFFRKVDGLNHIPDINRSGSTLVSATKIEQVLTEEEFVAEFFEYLI